MDTRAPMCLMTCGDGLEMARGVGAELGVGVIGSRDVWFSCGEGKHIIDTNVRGTDVYLFQQCYAPGGSHSVYDRLMMLLHAADAARYADADRVTAVIPYFPGARQDKRKGRTREGVSTGLFARLLQAAGISMVITVEPHNPALYGCFDPRSCVLEVIDATQTFAGYLRAEGLSAPIVTSTDAGGLELARRFALALSSDLVALSKERDYGQPSVVKQTTVIGDVSGADVLLVDDMVDTGGSVVAAVEALWAAGAQGVTVAALHMLLSGRAWERLNGLARAARERGVGFNVVGTSTVVHRDPPPYYRSFSLVPLMAQVIGSVNTRGSVADVVRRS